MPHRHEHQWACGHGWAHGHPLGYEQALAPGMLLSTLSTVLWIASFAVLAWALWQWISPYILPMLEDIFDTSPTDVPALEILRRRYAAGEIDAATYEQMRERLEASYRSGEQQPPS
jgi:putative membrane protein